MTISPLKIAGGTLNQTPLDFENNRKNILDIIKQAKTKGIDLLCLPELCTTGYGCEDMFLAEWVGEEAKKSLDIIAEHTQNITVTIGLPFIYNGNIYNCVALIQDCTVLGFYAKQNLANDGIHYEKRWFTSWNCGEKVFLEEYNCELGDVVFDVQGNKVGFEICEDAWVEQRPANNYSPIDIILNPSASHFSFGKWKTRKELVISSSQKYDCTYVYANLLGNESGRVIFDGDVYIAKKGKLLAQNKRFSFANFELIINQKEDSFTDKAEEFTQVESLALFDYWRKSKSNGFVLSLSGGADSSTCTVLIAEMWKRVNIQLSKEELQVKLSFLKKIPTTFSEVLTTVYQGTHNSSEDTLSSAKELAKELNATFYNWNIDEEVQSYTAKIETALKQKITWGNNDIALQNIQARTRSPIIWMMSNIKNALLITTSNRSEASVGYATMDGDTSGSISPIAGIDKDYIREWLLWANKNLDYDALKYVNNLNPSAELRPLEQAQEDEKDLMPYDVLNRIEQLLIRDKYSKTKALELLKNEFEYENIELYLNRFTALWQRNQWKRERYAPAFHLDDYNVDSRTWMRFPILSGGF